MLSLNYENTNYVMTQILKLVVPVSVRYVNISYVLAVVKGGFEGQKISEAKIF